MRVCGGDGGDGGDKLLRFALRRAHRKPDSAGCHRTPGAGSAKSSERLRHAHAQGQSSLSSVPADVLQESLEFLSASNLKSVAFVCKLWLSHVTTGPRLRAIVNLHGLLAIGGWDGDTELESAEFYSPSRDDWTPLPKMLQKRSHVGCAVVDRHVYVIGGRDDDRRLNTAERFDPLTGRWHSLPPMAKNRSSLALRAVGNCLFAFGGYDGSNEQITNECYSIGGSKWSFIAPLDSPRSQMASAALDDSIYLFGGCDNHGSRILDTAQRYNVVTNQFETLPAMQESRLSAAATVLDGMVYVLGGSDSQRTHQSVECFDPRSNRWMCAPDLTLMRVNLAATTFNDSIIVVGGFHATLNQLSCVERFYPSSHPRYDHMLPAPAAPHCGDAARPPGGVVRVNPPAGSPAPGGLWRACRELSDARDAVNVCVFE